MAQQSQTEGTPRNREVLVACLAIGCVLAVGALVVGIEDNLPGALLIYGAITSFILAFVHHWRRSRPFCLLLGGSFLTFVAGAVLHNLFYGLGQAFPDLPASVLFVLEAAHVVAFLVAVLVCPPAFLIGLVGWIACVAAAVWQRLSATTAG